MDGNDMIEDMEILVFFSFSSEYRYDRWASDC